MTSDYQNEDAANAGYAAGYQDAELKLKPEIDRLRAAHKELSDAVWSYIEAVSKPGFDTKEFADMCQVITSQRNPDQ